MLQVEFTLDGILINIRNHVRRLNERHREGGPHQKGCALGDAFRSQAEGHGVEDLAKTGLSWEWLKQKRLLLDEEGFEHLWLFLFVFFKFLLGFVSQTEVVVSECFEQPKVLRIPLRQLGGHLVQLLEHLVLVIHEQIAQEHVVGCLVGVEGAKADVREVCLLAVDRSLSVITTSIQLQTGLILSVKPLPTTSIGPVLVAATCILSIFMGQLCFLEVDERGLEVLREEVEDTAVEVEVFNSKDILVVVAHILHSLEQVQVRRLIRVNCQLWEVFLLLRSCL